jgi:hypothetical protein
MFKKENGYVHSSNAKEEGRLKACTHEDMDPWLARRACADTHSFALPVEGMLDVVLPPPNVVSLSMSTIRSTDCAGHGVARCDCERLDLTGRGVGSLTNTGRGHTRGSNGE